MNNWDEFRIERSILRIGTFLASRRNVHLRQLGLTASQSEALLFLQNTPPISITVLKNHLKISHQATRVLVERLKEKELVVVRQDTADSRSRLITLTPQGNALFAQLTHEGQAVGVRLLKSLSSEEMAQLDGLLQKISASLKAELA
ncbi:MAG: MarR family transcriptional regulator [Mailhella sp.]|nr:MarR family transcriptional regulator [Mailhella sp.]